jgi:hypothetical protein
VQDRLHNLMQVAKMSREENEEIPTAETDGYALDIGKMQIEAEQRSTS